MSSKFQNDIDALIKAYSDLEGRDMTEKIRNDIRRFVCHVFAANGEISGREAEYLSEILNEKYKAEDLIRFISEEHLTEPSFAKKPSSAYCAQIHDFSASYRYLTVLNKIGQQAVVCDLNPTQKELDAYEDYISMLADAYKNENPNALFKITINKSDDVYRPPRMPDPDEVEKLLRDYASVNTDSYEKTAAVSEDKQDEQDDIDTLEELLAELDGLVGLDSVKQNVHSLIHLQCMQLERESRGMKRIPMSNHLVFTGNPGTGKTTVARLIARIYKKIGLLSTGTFIETDRSGLVAGYVGQTALKVKEVLDSAKGGVLFIDEAYSLVNDSDVDYGKEAIETLLKRMEDERGDLVVIVAGYPDLMEKFVASNPGLRSRFSKTIYFPDYTPEELLDIMMFTAKKNSFIITGEATDYLSRVLTDKYNNRTEDFANGREVRNMFEAAVLKQADRLFGRDDVSDEDLCILELEDFIMD